MKSSQRLALAGTWVLAASLAVALLPISAIGAQSQTYTVTNLVADLPGVAAHTDTNLINPWGLAFDIPGNLVVADNGANLATFYQRSGNPIDLRVNAPTAPTGLVFNHSASDFLLSGSNGVTVAARFLFCTEVGTILAYHPAVDLTNTFVVADRSRSNSVYKGLTLGTLRGNRQIYAADFRNGKVDVFDTTFRFVGSFTDRGIPAGFAPFNVRNIGGIIVVTFAKQLLPEKKDDEAGPGNGFVDYFTTAGVRINRMISHGTLNSPWGIAVSPVNFGRFSNALLIGNFGDGRINAFNFFTGQFLGQLTQPNGEPIQLDGLWSLKFKQIVAGQGDDDSTPFNVNSLGPILYFTSGPNGEANGLVGAIRPGP
jgi:uncharacterized protein (TIGR03118 family)